MPPATLTKVGVGGGWGLIHTIHKHTLSLSLPCRTERAGGCHLCRSSGQRTRYDGQHRRPQGRASCALALAEVQMVCHVGLHTHTHTHNSNLPYPPLPSYSDNCRLEDRNKSRAVRYKRSVEEILQDESATFKATKARIALAKANRPRKVYPPLKPAPPPSPPPPLSQPEAAAASSPAADAAAAAPTSGGEAADGGEAASAAVAAAEAAVAAAAAAADDDAADVGLADMGEGSSAMPLAAAASAAATSAAPTAPPGRADATATVATGDEDPRDPLAGLGVSG